MWLDRLSGHSTPAGTPSASPPPPANRSYSPAARRPSQLGPATSAQRPGFNPRSSSLSLHSNDSTSSLLASSRRPNGSGLKQSVTVADAPDPLDVLEKLLGSERKEAITKLQVNGDNVIKDEFEFELDFEDLSLREFVSRMSSSAKEHAYTPQTVEECRFCVSTSQNYANPTAQSSETKQSLKIFTGRYVPAMRY
jgi:vacuolar protein sorting-associated protein 52